jgi:lipoic acid synthetase
MNRLDRISVRPIRHPEKSNNPDSKVLEKPDWIRVRARTSSIYLS